MTAISGIGVVSSDYVHAEDILFGSPQRVIQGNIRIEIQETLARNVNNNDIKSIVEMSKLRLGNGQRYTNLLPSIRLYIKCCRRKNQRRKSLY